MCKPVLFILIDSMMKSAEMATNIPVHYSALAFMSGHEIVVVVVDVGVSLASTSASPVRKKERGMFLHED